MLRITLCAVETITHTEPPIGMIVFEDISQITTLTKELDKATKLRTLGRLTANVAHELNSPLDGILRYVNLSIRQLQQKQHDRPLQYLEKTRHGLLRMAHIVSDLLDFTRNTYISSEQPTLEQMIDEAVHTVQTYMKTRYIQIHKSILYHLPIGQYQNLYQVFCNIIKNAYESMPQGGHLYIEAFPDQGHYLNITFHDTGEGFPNHIMDQVFDPFISTKDRGTGLGLAVCKDIVENYKGHIIAQNAAEGGAQITIRMPISEIT
jgi:signal transduction histidine kinase